MQQKTSPPFKNGLKILAPADMYMEHLWTKFFWVRLLEHIYILIQSVYRPFAATVSQLKISDFSGERCKGFEVLYFSMSATTAQLLSSG
jgi:hypothetical protein